MTYMIEVLKHLRNEKGQGMVEYGMIIAFVALVAGAAFTTLGSDLSTFITNVASGLTTTTTPSK